MPNLLVINPNTSAAVSALLHGHAQRIAGAGTQVHTVTARFGAPYIACEASYAVAGHAALDAWAAATAQGQEVFDSVLLACFGDPGLMALRESSVAPVTGLAEAAFMEAARIGRFAIVTGGSRWKPMLERLVRNLGLEAQLAGIQTVQETGAELARDPSAAQLILQTACQSAIERFNAQAIILGGAGLAGIARAVRPAVPVPIIDSVEAGVRHAVASANAPVAPNRNFEFAWHNVSAELASLGVNASG